MKKLITACFTAVFFVGSLLTGGIFLCNAVAASSEETVTLKQSMYPPEGHPYTEGAEEFADKVAEATEGRVKIECYPSASLCPPNRELAAASAGNIDMTLTVTTYIVGEIPLLQYTALPWYTPKTKEDVSKLNLEVRPIINKALEDYNVRLLMILSTPQNYVLVSKKEIRTPADMKGLRIRTAGGLTDSLVDNWGASAVSLPVSECYSGLHRGLIDGTILTVPSVKGMNIYEVAPYVTDLKMGLNAFAVMVNMDKWNKISKTDREAILDLVPEYLVYRTGNNMEDLEKQRAEWSELGVNVYEPTESELKQWQKAAKPLWESFAESGPQAERIVNMINKYGGGIPSINE